MLAVPSFRVFSVPFFTLIAMRLPLVMLIGAPLGFVSVSPFSVTVHLALPPRVSEPSSEAPSRLYVISGSVPSLMRSLVTASLCVIVTWAPLTVTSTYCAMLPATKTSAPVPLYVMLTSLSLTLLLSVNIVVMSLMLNVLPIMVVVLPSAKVIFPVWVAGN